MAIFISIVVWSFFVVVLRIAWVLAKVAAKVPPIPTVDIQKEEEKK